MRWIAFIPPITQFNPASPTPSSGVINLSLEEMEAIRLVDLEHLTQEEAAVRMGVSRKTLWNDLKSAREKLARALINGYAIRIDGGRFALHPSANLDNLDDKIRKIYKLLPGKNCGFCGYGSCINFARALSQGNASLDSCRFLDPTSKDETKKIIEGGDRKW